ncbi:hypothetical protein CLV92_102336 [Kineococcus xinjiangensis]|uniref:TrbL/VirB6 plasmid conjugal transfer protein n=1 Tax=Kineococcus xinjiangensis TaxID=512762 RepID=A0A2S6IVK3_9ACTN|nr:hypothetical protein [Kineococcus xinjiangensis]PPK98183.1 hypothetical protein CLV92_102336 [Kineococcus xinjiangensis]
MGPCDIPGVEFTPLCVGVEAGRAVQQAVSFGSDPLGYIAQNLQLASASLAGTVLPEMRQVTHPDLSVEWFLSAYRVSFALAVFTWVVLLGWNFVLRSRRRVSTGELVDTVAFYTPLFLGAVLLGPVLGTLLLRLTGALTDGIVAWGVVGSVEQTTRHLQEAIAAGGPAEMAGGAIISIVLFACLIVALLLALLTLLVMMVTLYLTGAILPLSLVWLTHPHQRDKGVRLVMVWIGICFSQVLLFLLLGVAFRMIGGLASTFSTAEMRTVANLAVAVIALLMATLAPVGLFRFAPVGPTASPVTGPALPLPRSGTRRYSESAHDSQTAQLSRANETPAAEDSDLDSADASSSAGSGGILAMVGRRGSRPSATTAMESDGTGAQRDADTGSAGSSAATTAAGGARGDEARVDGTRAVEAGGEPARRSGRTLTSAGAALAATGAGAVAGVATAAAGQVAHGVGSASARTAELARSGGDAAAEQMDHGDPAPAGDPDPGGERL